MIAGPTRDVTVEFDSEGRRGWILLWPKSFRLVSSIEVVAAPTDEMGVVHDKSTWARRGVTVQNTLIQPGWRGYLTLEVTNHSWRFHVLRRGDRLAQVVFHQMADVSGPAYSGRYQNQERGPQGPR